MKYQTPSVYIYTAITTVASSITIAFLSPPFGDLGATYDNHLRLVGKRIGDFLLVLIELFFARSYG